MRALALAACLLAAALAGSCSPVRNPATGAVEYTSLSPEQEARLGRQEHPQVLTEFGGAYADPRLQAYVEGVGRRLVAASDAPDIAFTFTVLDSDVVNAFALPGYVYVSRGLLALVDDEAELAGVLGHEIGHVAARHTARRYDRQLQGQLGATAAAIGGAVLGGLLGGDAGARLGGDLAGQLGSAGATAYVQGYSREQEFQADELGVRYLARAGYDPGAMATFLQALNANEALRARLDDGPSRSVPSWLSSHPRALERVERAVAAAGEGGAGGTLDRDAYLAAIDGLVFGDSPAQGYVLGSSFVHPELGVRFDAPPGFTLENSPERVTGSDGQGRYLLFDAAVARTAAEPAAYLEGEWAREQSLEGLRRLTVNGRPAALAYGRASLGGRPAGAMLAAVADQGGRMYRFAFLRQGAPIAGADARAFEASLASFGPIPPAEAAARRPLRIDVVEVGPGDTIDSLAARMVVERGQREWFALLNDLDRRPLRPGDRVKLVVRG